MAWAVLSTNLFAKAFGGAEVDSAYSIIQTSDGGFAVAGWTYSFGAGRDDLLVLKLSSDGSLEWTKTFGGMYEDQARSIIQTSDGGFAVAGETYSFGAGCDLLVLKLSSDGSLEWARTFGRSSMDKAYSIIQTSDGGFAVAGLTSIFGPENYDFLVLTLPSDGSYENCVHDVMPTEQSVSPTVTSPSPSISEPSLLVSSPSLSVFGVFPSIEDVCPPGALCESSPSPRLTPSPFPGGVLFLSPAETEIKIYTVDGKLVRSLKLKKGKNRVYLKPGVYLWQAEGKVGKAVVR